MQVLITVLMQTQDQFSTDPKVKALLQRVKLEKARRKQHDEAYYHDDQLDELLQRPLDGEIISSGSEAHLNGKSFTGSTH
jgi:hypothetical protein